MIATFIGTLVKHGGLGISASIMVLKVLNELHNTVLK